jgi:hypothetical protein
MTFVAGHQQHLPTTFFENGKYVEFTNSPHLSPAAGSRTTSAKFEISADSDFTVGSISAETVPLIQGLDRFLVIQASPLIAHFMAAEEASDLSKKEFSSANGLTRNFARSTVFL